MTYLERVTQQPGVLRLSYSVFTQLAILHSEWEVYKFGSPIRLLRMGDSNRRIECIIGEDDLAALAAEARYAQASEVVAPDDAWAEMIGLVELTAPPTGLDGTPLVVVSPGKRGWMYYNVGAGDTVDGTLVRGGGTRIRLDFNSGPESQDVKFRYREPIFIHSAKIVFTGEWDLDDIWSFGMVVPANVPVVAPSVDGSIDLEILSSGAKRCKPNAGSGTHTLSLTTAAPVWNAKKKGYYDVDEETGVITNAKKAGKGRWDLLNVGVESFFATRRSLGHKSGEDRPPTFDAEWIHPTWELRLAVNKTSAGSGKISGDVVIWRENAT